jgi:hypothetical protein
VGLGYFQFACPVLIRSSDKRLSLLWMQHRSNSVRCNPAQNR